MSSSAFYCQLIPSPQQRRMPLLSGCLAALCGSTMLLHMPLNPALRALLAVAWMTYSGLQIARQAQTAAGVRRLRLDSDGELHGRTPGGEWIALRLLPGSVVWRRHAWLRLRTPRGRDYGEYLTGRADVAGEWHRLQLIWRQRSAAFGHN